MSSPVLLTAPAVNSASAAKNSSGQSAWVAWIRAAREFALPGAAISIVFVMLVPLPSLVLDLLLGLSIAAAVLVFLSAVQVRKAVDFSVFPTVLLLLTLFRLSLNIASSRRILLHGSEGVSAAGSVIEAFGQFVVGGNYVVGFVLFLALIAIQFLVVSHGAVRTAEVTARFTLDALPGKQMAIDADLNAGLIDEVAARKRREAVAREAEFYGAMDGAARFNQRDSMATILITAINIIAGLLIGTLQQGVALGEALKTYTTLTVGDGLVTMIPVAAGLGRGRHGPHPRVFCRCAGYGDRRATPGSLGDAVHVRRRAGCDGSGPGAAEGAVSRYRCSIAACRAQGGTPPSGGCGGWSSRRGEEGRREGAKRESGRTASDG